MVPPVKGCTCGLKRREEVKPCPKMTRRSAENKLAHLRRAVTMEMDACRPSPPLDVDDRTLCVVSVKGLKENWQRWSAEHQEYQKHNPFSGDRRRSVSVQLQRGEDGYGTPLEGSLTQQRGRDAQSHIGREVEELCRVIREMAAAERRGGEESRPAVEFGRLFERYVTISNKVVGILLRARKQGLVHFKGEMLWQGQDDHTLITLLQ